jgi:small subunit ribosomal protein S1
MSWTKKVKHPSKVLEVGQEVETQVLEVDSKSKRISLGLKQLEPDPWTVFTEKYSPGAKIGGQVRSITDYGVFIGIEEGVDGMVHKSDISWTAKVNNPADLYKKGDHVEAIILSINHDEKKVSLGVKQLWDDPWPTIFSELPPGKVVHCKVLSIVDYGVFVHVRDGVEGLIPQNELVLGADESGKEKALRPGDELDAEIANIDTQERRITLSMRMGEAAGAPAAAPGGGATEAKPAPRQSKAPKKSAAAEAAAGGTIGELIKQKLGAKLAGIGEKGEKKEADEAEDKDETEKSE